MKKYAFLARIYAQIESERQVSLPPSLQNEFPRDVAGLLGLLSGYLGHSYEVVRSDFALVDAVRSPEGFEKLDSFVVVERRPNPTDENRLPRRPVRIHVNIGEVPNSQYVDDNWTRFLVLKGAFEAILYEEREEPQGGEGLKERLLFERTEAFSLLELDAGDTGNDVVFHQGAELLALGFLYPFEHALTHQLLCRELFHGDLASIDLRPVADHYKVPQRYVESLMSWPGLSTFVSQIEDFNDYYERPSGPEVDLGRLYGGASGSLAASSVFEIFAALVALNGGVISSSRSDIDQEKSDEEVENLEPTVLVGLLGSIASIIGLLQQNKKILSPEAVLAQFRKRAEDTSSPEYKLGRVSKDADVLANARTMIGVYNTDSMFLDRIREKCLNPYYEAIGDHELDDVDLEDVRGKTANCVCTNINIARKDSGGTFPSDEFKELWKKFGCA